LEDEKIERFKKTRVFIEIATVVKIILEEKYIAARMLIEKRELTEQEEKIIVQELNKNWQEFRQQNLSIPEFDADNLDILRELRARMLYIFLQFKRFPSEIVNKENE
jgi:hypothetical protein